MTKHTYTNAANANAAGARSQRFSPGICAYPWPIGDTRARTTIAGMTVVLTESKHHFRWPRDPSS